jgi:polyketide cyclase/dehydrase/lipid transport protein
METLTRTDRFDVRARASEVFPLLCPVLEYKWIPTWSCELLHSVSGVAEEDCVFRTHFPDGDPMTWVVSHYEPPRRIEFSCFVPDLYVMRLKIALTEEDGATRLEWTRRWLSVGPKGDRWIAGWSDAEHHQLMERLRDLLSHYLTTGEMLPA